MPISRIELETLAWSDILISTMLYQLSYTGSDKEFPKMHHNDIGSVLYHWTLCASTLLSRVCNLERLSTNQRRGSGTRSYKQISYKS
jgi:hypothetical protein